jgi:hypothetical protein
MSFRRSLPFILLNILISAATMLIVLAIWETAHRVPVSTAPGNSGTPMVGVSNCTSSLLPAGTSILSIINVIGAGDLNKEEVDLEYTGTGSFCMSDWQISSQAGERFTFPKYFQFYSGGVVIKIYSRAGTDTPLELFWGLQSSIWHSGSTVRLLDSQGKEQASFKIP